MLLGLAEDSGRAPCLRRDCSPWTVLLSARCGVNAVNAGAKEELTPRPALPGTPRCPQITPHRGSWAFCHRQKAGCAILNSDLTSLVLRLEGMREALSEQLPYAPPLASPGEEPPPHVT